MLGTVGSTRPASNQVWWGWETPEDGRAVAEIFASEGIPAEPRRVERPVGDPGMGIFVGVIAGMALGAFLNGYFGAAGADAWKGTKRLVTNLRKWFIARYGRSPVDDFVTVMLVDPDTGAAVLIRSDLPRRAFRELHELQFERNTEYVWDFDAGEWRGERVRGGVMRKFRALFQG